MSRPSDSKKTDRPISRLIAALLALVVAGACSNGDDPNTILANGYVEATEIRLATKIGGTLDSFSLSEGDRTSEGAMIARIETTDLELQLVAAGAQRDLAAAELALKRAGFRDEEVAEARARAERAATELAAAERDHDRFQGLLESGSGTAKARDDALARRDMAARALEAARQRQRLLEAGFRAEEISAAQARCAAAAARIAILEQQVRDATVTCPVAGVVTATLAEPGELVAPGSTLALITDLDDAWLTAYVAEPDLGRIRLGQEAEVITDGGEVRIGHLSFISQMAEFTPKNVQTSEERVKLVYKIKIGLANADGMFKPGMPATARLPGNQ